MFALACSPRVRSNMECIGLNPVALVEGFAKCFYLDRKALSRVLCVLSH